MKQAFEVKEIPLCMRTPLNTGNTVTHFLERVMIGTSGGLGLSLR